MSILLKVERESGGQPIELGNGQITGYSYTNTSPADFLAKAYNVVHSIQIRGEIPLRLLPPVEQDADNSNTLYAWALTEYRPDNDYYRTVTVQIVRHEKTIREVKFTHAYVHVYQEQVNGLKGVLEFELVVRQRRDQLDNIRLGSVINKKEKHTAVQSSVPKIDFWEGKSQSFLMSADIKPNTKVDPTELGIRRDLNQMAWYNKNLSDGTLGNKQWAQSMLDSGTYFVDIDNYVPGVYLTFKDLENRGIDATKVRDINIAGVNTLSNPKKVSEKLINFVIDYETFKSKPYRGQDNKNLTIGYGHVIKNGEYFGEEITEEKAREILLNDLASRERYVRNWAIDNNVVFSQQQYDAIVDFVFNAGEKVLLTSYSVVAQLIKSGDYTNDQLKNEFLDWAHVTTKTGKIFSPGVYRRRLDEWQIFEKGEYNRDSPDVPKN
ncbi:lysozyme [Paenibacillus tyrfis]|uniref:lysozyme n=1 Tax=Paenibacillus tyrfis TaxID=1501230 RepID=UPI00209F7D39|nr:lysozyme [Paenibacillus tyrfis]MCP1309854.1 lysozyme [Paenibacillus tyrfis]